MLHFITDAPQMVVREIIALAGGWFENPLEDAPIWVETIIHVPDVTAMSVLHALREYRVESRRAPRVAIGDPTFVMAAAAIERSGGTPSSAALAR